MAELANSTARRLRSGPIPQGIIEPPASENIALARRQLLDAQAFQWSMQSALAAAKGSDVGRETIDSLREITAQAEAEVAEKLMSNLKLELAA